MNHPIQELRPDRLEAALAFAASKGCTVADGRVIVSLTLVVPMDDGYAAAAICVECGRHRHRLELAIGDADPTLHRALVDKALMKLTAAGVRKFDIRTNGQAEQGDFWRQVSWIDQTLGEQAA